MGNRWVVVGICLCVICSPALGAVYIITDLGQGSVPVAINSGGLVVYSSGFLDSATTLMGIFPTPPGGQISDWFNPAAVNTNGLIAGSATISGASHALIYSYTGTTYTDLSASTFTSGGNVFRPSTATGINAAGQVIGQAIDVNNSASSVRFLYSNGDFTVLTPSDYVPAALGPTA